jgi:hypothetical protein
MRSHLYWLPYQFRIVLFLQAVYLLVVFVDLAGIVRRTDLWNSS